MSCPPDKIVTDFTNGIVVCTENGIVLDIVYDYSPPRVYEPKDYVRVNNSPVNPVFHDYGIHTEISDLPNCREVDAEQVNKIKRLKNLNSKLRFNTSARRHVTVIKIAREILSKLNVPSLLPDVASLLRQIKQRPVCRNCKVLAATLVYIACRTRDVPRTLQDIADVANLSKDEIGRCYRNLVEKLNLKLQPYSPTMFVPRVASILGLPGEVSALAVTLVNTVHDKCGEFQGNDPLGVAAGVVYIAAIMKGRRIPQIEIAKKIGVSEATIRARYREVVDCLKRFGIHVSEP